MIVIPTRITNIVFLISFVLSACQHWWLNRGNPATNLQFIMMVYSMLMLLVVTLNRTDLRLPLACFLIAGSTLFLTIRQRRKLPPSRAFG